jgi:CxxC-x17-CxxC domain-containing protein
MDQGKIMIMNLSKGRIGEDNSRLLGALLVTKLQLAAMSRVDIPEEKWKDFFLYVDEFQNFATESFVNVLSEARKYRLALVLANQYIAQMEEMTPTGRSTKVRDAVFGNVGTLICFRVGAEDAEFLEKELIPDFIAEDLVNLGKYNIYLKLMIDGISGRPFSAETLAPIPPSEKSNKEKIIKVCRQRYSTPQKEVEEKISRWTETLTLPTTPQPAPPVLYDARCATCGKDTKVTFRPDGVRPVFCKSCRRKLEQERGERQERQKEREIPSPRPSFPQEREGPREQALSLEEATKKEPVPFAPSRKPKNEQSKPKRKEVNLEELKKVLQESLKEKPKNENSSGIIEPGETVKF